MNQQARPAAERLPLPCRRHACPTFGARPRRPRRCPAARSRRPSGRSGCARPASAARTAPRSPPPPRAGSAASAARPARPRSVRRPPPGPAASAGRPRTGPAARPASPGVAASAGRAALASASRAAAPSSPDARAPVPAPAPASPAAAPEQVGPPPRPRKSKIGRWVALLVIAGGVGGAVWYGTHAAPTTEGVGDCLAQTGGNQADQGQLRRQVLAVPRAGQAGGQDGRRRHPRRVLGVPDGHERLLGGRERPAGAGAVPRAGHLRRPREVGSLEAGSVQRLAVGQERRVHPP